LMILPGHGVTVSHICRHSANPRAGREPDHRHHPDRRPRRGHQPRPPPHPRQQGDHRPRPVQPPPAEVAAPIPTTHQHHRADQPRTAHTASVRTTTTIPEHQQPAPHYRERTLPTRSTGTTGHNRTPRRVRPRQLSISSPRRNHYLPGVGACLDERTLVNGGGDLVDDPCQLLLR
jgi:hypothetical protein